MVLDISLYNEIMEKEQKWIDSIQLLNSIYCNLELKPFYLQKRADIEKEFEKSNNVILGEFLKIIDNIVQKIDNLYRDYKNSLDVDIQSLLPYFFTYQLNNNLTDDINTNSELNEIDRLEIKKQIIQNEIKNHVKNENSDEVYDDFPEEF